MAIVNMWINAEKNTRASSIFKLRFYPHMREMKQIQCCLKAASFSSDFRSTMNILKLEDISKKVNQKARFGKPLGLCAFFLILIWFQHFLPVAVANEFEYSSFYSYNKS